MNKFIYRPESEIDYAQLEADVKRYQGLISSKETRSCLLDLGSLNHLLAYIQSHNAKAKTAEKIGGLRIYLFKTTNADMDKKKLQQNPTRSPHGFSKFDEKFMQLGIAIVPVKNYKLTGNHNPSGTDATDLKNPDIIYGIIPGLTNEGGGMCPVNCGK